MGIFNAATLSTKGMRAWAPGANICAGIRLRRYEKAQNNRLTNAVFTRTLCKGNVRNVVMHITRFVFIQGAKAARRVLLCRQVSSRKRGDVGAKTYFPH
jgi:hypothetical protein